MQALAYAPLHLWPLAFIALALLYAVLYSSGEKGGRIGLVYGAGLFLVGASWIYNSLHDYGTGEMFSAGFITAVFLFSMALFYALACGLFTFLRTGLALVWWPLLFAALWVCLEWTRGLVFPWLYLGHSQPEALFAPWLGVVGALGVSFLMLWCATAVVSLPLLQGAIRWVVVAVVAGIALGGVGLSQKQWTNPREALQVHLVQPAVPQVIKWDPTLAPQWLERLLNISEPALQKGGLVVWPEAAVTLDYAQVRDWFDELMLGYPRSALLYGVVERTRKGAYNTLAAAGAAQGSYRKQQLVPFGEYIPFPDLLSGIVDLFGLHRPQAREGSDRQGLIRLGNMPVASLICYEIAYDNLTRLQARKAQFIVTVSNDTWFGRSLGPEQHLQLAQVRARENARAVVRATNDGISALIAADGKILQRLDKGEQGLLSGKVYPRTGTTPYQRLGNIPVLALILLVLLAALGRRLWSTRVSGRGRASPEQ